MDTESGIKTRTKPAIVEEKPTFTESPDDNDRNTNNQNNTNAKSKLRSWRRNRTDEGDKDAESITQTKAIDSALDNEPEKYPGLSRKKADAKPDAGDVIENDIEQNRQLDDDSQQHHQGAVRILEPLRTDPIASFQTRQKRLDRLSAEELPEIHFIGQITSAEGMLMDENEGVLIRWSIDAPSSWQHLGGEVLGQTQVSYCRNGLGTILEKTCVPLNHPFDVHYAFYGLQGWGSSRISIQGFRMDNYGRRILCGYGFVHLPSIPGRHKLEIQCWRPLGSPEQEAGAFFLGSMPALVSEKVIYESAWADRCRLVTSPAGKVYIEVYVIGRFLHRHSIDTTS